MRLLDSKMSLARKGDKEAYKFVYDSIKPDFINKVKKIYGNDVDTLKIEKIYDEMMNEYLYKDTKTYIKDALMRRAKTCLNEYPSFDELIVTDPERIKKHYIEKEYNEIINKINLKNIRPPIGYFLFYTTFHKKSTRKLRQKSTNSNTCNDSNKVCN